MYYSLVNSTIGYNVHEEVHCVGEGDSNRRADIIAILPNAKNGFIIDPTVRIEVDEQQPEAVNVEKQGIYNPCIPYLKDKYDLEEMEVIGLLVGARGTIPQFFKDFANQFRIPKSVIDSIAISAVKGSAQILHNHLHNNNQ